MEQFNLEMKVSVEKSGDEVYAALIDGVAGLADLSNTGCGRIMAVGETVKSDTAAAAWAVAFDVGDSERPIGFRLEDGDYAQAWMSRAEASAIVDALTLALAKDLDFHEEL